MFCIGRVAQWIRRPTSNRKIVGSIPIVVSFLESLDFVPSRPSAKGRLSSSIVGSVVEFSPATRETGVRFPDNAGFLISCQQGDLVTPAGFSLDDTHCWFSGRILACHAGDRGSIPRQCTRFCMFRKIEKISPLRVGFEPTREDPI